jgi:hypothetical protein
LHTSSFETGKTGPLLQNVAIIGLFLDLFPLSPFNYKPSLLGRFRRCHPSADFVAPQLPDQIDYGTAPLYPMAHEPASDDCAGPSYPAETVDINRKVPEKSVIDEIQDPCRYK